MDIKNKKIVISKINQIGDVILSLPIAGALKKKDKSCKIFYLVKKRVVEGFLKYCTDVDGIIDWEEIDKKNDIDAISILEKEEIDIFINVFNSKKVAEYAKKAKIPVRIGTINRPYYWTTCNHFAFVSRKKSKLNETELDLKMISPILGKKKYSKEEVISFSRVKKGNLDILKHLSDNKFNLIIHPKTRGAHIEWSNEHYIELISKIDETGKFNIILTGSPSEYESMKYNIIEKSEGKIIDLAGKTSLEELTVLISNADGIIAHSTGPVHLGAVFGINTLGIYAPIKPFDGVRWGPYGKNAEFISVAKTCDWCRDFRLRKCKCVNEVTPLSVYEKVLTWDKVL